MTDLTFTASIEIYKLAPNVILPSYRTAQSVCFDIHAYLRGPNLTEDKYPIARTVKIINSKNEVQETKVRFTFDSDDCKADVEIPPHGRALIPTGFIMELEPGFSVRLHARSGLSFKHGISLANAEGVIDSDYREEVFVALINNSDQPYVIKHGDRIAQGELVECLTTAISIAKEKPSKVTERTGGFGSTGV